MVILFIHQKKQRKKGETEAAPPFFPYQL